MVQINWTIRAKEDIKNIANYIARDAIYYAEKQIQRLYYEYPQIGKPVPEYNVPQLRQILVGKCRIIYRLVND